MSSGNQQGVQFRPVDGGTPDEPGTAPGVVTGEAAEAAWLLSRYRDDPQAFCEDVFHESPREWQPAVVELARRNPRLAIKACRKAGKSRLAAMLAIWFLCTRFNSLVVTVAPIWSQVRRAIWKEIRTLWIRSPILAFWFPNAEVLMTTIYINRAKYPGWMAYGVASDNPQNLEGTHGEDVLVILDESKEISDDVRNSVDGMLWEVGCESRLLAIGTPGAPRGWYYRSFTRDRELWATYGVKATDIPRLAERVALHLREWGPRNPWFRQQELAEFAAAEDGALIPFDKIEDAAERGKTGVARMAGWPKVMALDVAGAGSNRNVLSFRLGPIIRKQLAWQHWEEMQTAAYVFQCAVKYRPEKVVIDGTGLGGPVANQIARLMRSAKVNIPVFRFISGKPPRSPRARELYANLKMEEAMYLRERFMNGSIAIPDEPRLIGDLSAWITDTHVLNGKTKLVDPEGDDSPDFGDSCLMAFAADRIGQGIRGVKATRLG